MVKTMIDIKNHRGNDELRARAASRRRRPWQALALIALLAGGACDFDVADPAAIKDEALNDPVILPALLNGVRGSFTFATNGPVGGRGVFIASSLLTDELVHVGQELGLREFSDGRVRDDSPEVADLWAEASRSRWTAEDLVRRLDAEILRRQENEQAVGSYLNALAEALIWAGFSNRVLGENFCAAVVDNGPQQPREYFFERAEAQFSRAIEVATIRNLEEFIPLAIAGRAQVRMLAGDWEGALEDAQLVPTEFDYKTIQYYPSEREANGYRTLTLPPNNVLTVWGTPFADWARRSGTTTGDPRIPYTIPLSGGQPQTGLDNRRPHWQQIKYNASNVGIAVAKGTEMRLIEAEALLLAGRWEDAVDKIQEVRDYHNAPPRNRNLPPASAAGEGEAWELLMRERGIELWLEGRRLGDVRRWAVNPGYVPLEVVREAGAGDPANDPRRNVLDLPGEACIPISRQERITNPNL